MVTVSAPLEQYFKDFLQLPTKRERSMFPEFRVRCCVVRRRPPRHKGWDHVRDMGMSYLDKIFKKEPLSGTLTLVFPERWLGGAEQQGLVSCVKNNPTVDQITQLDIITSSPLVVSAFINEQVRVLTFQDDNEYNAS